MSSGFKLQIGGQNFAIEGVNYSPVPTGQHPGSVPYGDYFTSNYANVWNYDIEQMRATGVNAIKLYGGDPGANAGAPGSGGNWKPFLDKLYNGGDRPIYVIMTSYVQGGDITAGGANFNNYKTQWTNLVASTVNHPAVLGYVLGNEIMAGQTGNAAFWNNYGDLLDTATSAGTAQGQNPFIISAIADAYAGGWAAIQQGESSRTELMAQWLDSSHLASEYYFIPEPSASFLVLLSGFSLLIF
ncbi:MAG: hypothetical protein ACK5LK_04805 [Chthoniobacterales bacterium]